MLSTQQHITEQEKHIDVEYNIFKIKQYMLRYFNSTKKISEESFFNFENDRNFLIKNILKNLKNIEQKNVPFVALNNTEIEIFFINKINNNNLFKFFKNSILYQLNYLVDIIGVDFPGKKKRFGLIYVCQSITFNSRINLLTRCEEKERVISLSNIFKNANWHEREVWDMFGILFKNNNDLRRILTDYGFSGHPLRKDFPLTGFYEIFFIDSQKTIKSYPVSLAQEYRKFYFPLPW